MELFRKKDLSRLLSERAAREKTYGFFDLFLLGIGAIIGTGILVLTGIIASTQAGPAVILSFAISALAAIFIGLCYAEVATSIPNSGSIYGYAWVVLGQFPAHLLGWTMIGVYILSAATVANGWTGYFAALFRDFGIEIPEKFLMSYSQGGIVNLPAILIVLLISFILTRGSKESKAINNVMVILKLSILALFVGVGIFYIEPMNWAPFAPFGASGVFAGAATAFFAYLGFDTLATRAEEVKDVQKTLPKTIIISVLASTTLYIVVCLILTGVTRYSNLNKPEAMTFAMDLIGHPTVAMIISAGSVVGILAVILAFSLGASNITMSMSQGGFFPKIFSKMNKKSKSPNFAILCIGLITALFAGVLDVKALANLANIGSLIAFAILCYVLMKFRKMYPDSIGGFKVPLYPVVPILGIATCTFLIINLDLMSWISYALWLVIGSIIYFTYSKKTILA